MKSWSAQLPRTALRGELAALAALFAVSIGWKVVALRHADQNAFGISAALWLEPLPAYLGQFALGMVLAALAAAKPRVRIPSAVCWAIAVAAFWTLATRIGLHGSTSDHLTSARYLARHELNTVIAVALVAPIALGTLRGCAARVFELRPIVFVGVVSYGIYLYGVGVLVFMLKEGLVPVDTGSRVAFLAIAVAASVLLGWASQRIVERPCIALGRRLADSRQRNPTGTGDHFAGLACANTPR